MGAATAGGLSRGGTVNAVILDVFTKTNMHAALGSVEVVSDMSARKAGLYAPAAAYVALPGGLGTLEELAEVLSWRQLGFHTRPIVLLGCAFWRPLVEWVRQAVEQGFVAGGQGAGVNAFAVVDTPEVRWVGVCVTHVGRLVLSTQVGCARGRTAAGGWEGLTAWCVCGWPGGGEWWRHVGPTPVGISLTCAVRALLLRMYAPFHCTCCAPCAVTLQIPPSLHSCRRPSSTFGPTNRCRWTRRPCTRPNLLPRR